MLSAKFQELIDRGNKYPQHSSEWYSIRKKIITASDVVTILELNKYKTVAELELEKRNNLNNAQDVQQVNTNTNNLHTEWGNRYEPIAKSFFKKHLNLDIYDVGLITHTLYPWLAASPDGLVSNNQSLIEIKCPSIKNISDKVSQDHYAQMQIQMEVCDVDTCYYVQCQFAEGENLLNYAFSGETCGIKWYLRDYNIQLVHRDKEWFKHIFPILEGFWSIINRKDAQTEISEEYKITDQNIMYPPVIYENINWRNWISPNSLRNYMLDDPILDWLDIFWKNPTIQYNLQQNQFLGLVNPSQLPMKNQMLTMLQKRGNIFEKQIVNAIETKHKIQIRCIYGETNPRSLEKYINTINAMKEGCPIIYQGILRDENREWYGVPDLIVRSDYINRIFIKPALPDSEIYIPSVFSPYFHYLIVDIKNTILCLTADGKHLINAPSVKTYKSQVYLYKEMLSHIQNYNSPYAFILGNSWQYTSFGKTYFGNSYFDRAGCINFNAYDKPFIDQITAGINWVKILRSEGHTWAINPPSRSELYPNMNNDRDHPWHSIKEFLAEQNGELTLIANVGPINRANALRNGINSWRDPRCNAAVLGINGEKIGPQVDAILSTNRGSVPVVFGTKKFPLAKTKVCFYLDFETATVFNENTNIGTTNKTEDLIFMIGLGWSIRGENKWNYMSFVSDHITKECELDIFLKMHDKMAEVLAQNNTSQSTFELYRFTVYHWANAEKSIYDRTASKYLKQLKIYKYHLSWEWYDLYNLFRSTPITVLGSLTFGLKNIAKALYLHGIIQSTWQSHILDGSDAMANAIECNRIAIDKGVNLIDVPYMQKIVNYNEIDCKVLMEIVTYLLQQTGQFVIDPESAIYVKDIIKKVKTETPYITQQNIPKYSSKVAISDIVNLQTLPASNTSKPRAKKNLNQSQPNELNTLNLNVEANVIYDEPVEAIDLSENSDIILRNSRKRKLIEDENTI